MTAPTPTLSDKAIAYLRTVLPGLWAAVVAWAIAQGVLPTDWSDEAVLLGQGVLMPIVLAVLYPGLRWLEHRLPAWLLLPFIGAPKRQAMYDLAA